MNKKEQKKNQKEIVRLLLPGLKILCSKYKVKSEKEMLDELEKSFIERYGATDPITVGLKYIRNKQIC